MNYFKCVSSPSILGRPGLLAVLAACAEDPQTVCVEKQNTQKQLRMQALGAEIARVRRQAGITTQEDLRRVSGVGVRTISAVETGVKIPRVTTMRKIENALNLPTGSTDDFMAGKLERLEPKPTTPDDGPGGIYERVERDDIERAMMAIRGETRDVKWSFVFDRRERLRDEGSDQNPSNGPIGVKRSRKG